MKLTHALNLKEYLNVISDPIDFGTIRNKLFNNTYNDLKEFDADCKLLLANSKAFNTNKRSKVSFGEDSFNYKHVLQKKISLLGLRNDAKIGYALRC